MKLYLIPGVFQNPFRHTPVTWKATHDVNATYFCLLLFSNALSGRYAIVLMSKASYCQNKGGKVGMGN